MPSTLPVNTQQVLQMGTHTEKLQHTMQNLPNVVAQQVDKERQVADELKRRQVQDLDPSSYIEETDPHTKQKKRVIVKKNNDPDDETPEPPVAESTHQGFINIIV